MSTESERAIEDLFGRLGASDKTFRGIFIWQDPMTGQFKIQRVSEGNTNPTKFGVLRATLAQHQKKPFYSRDEGWPTIFGSVEAHPLAGGYIFHQGTSEISAVVGAQEYGPAHGPGLETPDDPGDSDLSVEEWAAVQKGLTEYYTEMLGSPRNYLRALKARLAGT